MKYIQICFRLDPSYIEIRMGVYNFSNPTERTKTFAVEKIWIHEDYERVNHTNDIALLRLSKKAYFTPICLPEASTRYENEDRAVVAGWGRTLSAEKSDVIKKATLNVLKNEACKYHHKELITRKTLCAHSYKYGACNGDSGGPLICRPNYQREVCGIVSLAPRCGDPLFPGIYTRVTEYLDWIKSIIEADGR